MTSPAKVPFKGKTPTVKIDVADVKKIIGNPERFKYEAAWDHDDYRKFSPGEVCFPIFMDTVKPQRNSTFVDWGAGTGRAGHAAWKNGLDVTMVDFVPTCLDEQVRDDLCDTLTFVEHDLTKPLDKRSDWGYCCDVLEHIPEEDIDKVLKNVLYNSRECFFNISTVEDHFGDELGHGPLHVTVRPYGWWLQKFAEFECVILHSNEFANHVLFHVSAHKNFWWTRIGGVNTSQEKIHENIKENAKWGVKQATPHEAQDTEVMLLSGGPSLNDFEDEIIQKHKDGMPVITVNGTYQWAQERGIHNVNQFMLDAREFNNRFVDPVRDDCFYFIASQCDPSVFEKLPKERVFMWHVSLEDEDLDWTSEHYGEMYKDWYPVPGGCSVTLRTLCALQMLGYRKVHVYGFDSSIREEHHAYDQPENDGDNVIDFRVAKGTQYEKSFKCADWMATQAKEFTKLANHYFKDMDLIIYGDGLISYITETGAKLT